MQQLEVQITKHTKLVEVQRNRKSNSLEVLKRKYKALESKNAELYKESKCSEELPEFENQTNWLVGSKAMEESIEKKKKSRCEQP